MISMDKKQQILHYYRVDRLSLREISRRVSLDRKTVRRIVRGYEEAVAQDPETGVEDYLSMVPRYRGSSRPPRVLTDAVIKEIDRWLKENDRRSRNGMRKQCLKKKDIHRELASKGFKVSYPTVCRYIRRKQENKPARPTDVYLRIRHAPGEECQFDWGEVKLFIAGKQESLMMAVFAFPFSKGRFAYLFHRQDTLAFMEAHRNFFRDVEGVPRTMVYDNMRVAVVFDNKEKRPTEALMRLSTFYRFGFRYCNARAGWEKGDVERSVDYVRGRAFTVRVDFGSMEEAQQWLTKTCMVINGEQCSPLATGRDDRIAEEMDALGTYPGEFGCFEMAEYKVDKQATICVRNNHYSVPEELAGESVVARIYSEKIVVYNRDHQKVATHQRSYGHREWVIDINHYIATLMKKTAALEYSEAFHQMPMSMQVIYNRYFMKNGKEFLGLVRYVRDNGVAYETVLEAADILRQRGLKEFTADHFKVAIHALTAVDEPFRDDQKSDAFIEIEAGSEDILSQLENAMDKGLTASKTNQ